MKKILTAILLLISTSLFAQYYNPAKQFNQFFGKKFPRFIVTRFDTAEEAVRYVNEEVERANIPHTQFITEFDARSTSPASYVVIVDRNLWLQYRGTITAIGEWNVEERMNLNDAVDMINRVVKLYPEGIEIHPNLVGYWNPNINPHSTTISTFFVQVQTSRNKKCEYSIVDQDLGAPSVAMDHLKDGLATTIDTVEFVNQFNVGSSVFGSLWLVKGNCNVSSSVPMHWQLVEVDEMGNSFDVESAVRFAERQDYNFVKFVSFTSPSPHNSRSRVLVFHHN